MALKGTLKDFGIADILQLIGQQQKTGLLHLKAKEQEVHVGFSDGNIVKAESSTRNKKDLIGNMLVRAEIISEQQLIHALDVQKRTLQRLGDVLVASNAITPERFKRMVHLQTTETLYKLFSWKSGSYGFEQCDLDWDKESTTPLRAESVLMEGFRMVDEWPLIKRKITGYTMTFQRLKDLPPPTPSADSVDAALDDAFGDESPGGGGGGAKSEFKAVGESERKVYELAVVGRDVRKLIDLSCLGEFETCKALCNLVNLDYLKPVAGMGKAEELVGEASFGERLGGAVGRVLVTMLVLSGLALLATQIDLDAVSFGSAPASSYTDPAAQRLISRQQMTRIGAALDVYRLEKGQVPEKLDALVEVGLLEKEDLNYPWRDPYYYRRTPEGAFVLLPPLR